MDEKQILVDSDFLVALYKPNDASHQRAKILLQKLKGNRTQFVALSLVMYESVTVISRKMGMDDARRFYVGLKDFTDKVVIFDQELEKAAWEIFLKQTKKGCSFVDCANLVTLEKYKFAGIATFDRFYPEKVRLK